MARTQKHVITLVNHPDFNNPDHVTVASKRLGRALRKARALRLHNPNVMLYKVDVNGDRFPISLKTPAIPDTDLWRGQGCNSGMIMEPADLQKLVSTGKIRARVQAEHIRSA